MVWRQVSDWCIGKGVGMVKFISNGGRKASETSFRSGCRAHENNQSSSLGMECSYQQVFVTKMQICIPEDNDNGWSWETGFSSTRGTSRPHLPQRSKDAMKRYALHAFANQIPPL